jgi:tetratricopeptide (TPR) repeat protein
MDPNITAFRALWRDTHARFAVDPRRIYAGGFSGGARVATLMATSTPGTVTGVIGCGAGFHLPPKARPAFLYFGAVGNRDFNHDEMRELDETLGRLGAVRHIEVFDGEHAWPPEDICSAALEWMHFQAQSAGAIPADPGIGDRLLARFADRAAALERGGHRAAAMTEYERAIADFRGRRDVSTLERELVRLEESAEGCRARRAELDRTARDEAYRDRLTRCWGEIRSGEPIPFGRLINELELAGLKARAAKKPGSDDALSAERLLSEVFVQTAFYLPRGYRQEKNYERAILCVSIASEVRPESSSVWYDLAALEALAGHPDKALDDLATAVARGYTDGDELARDADFASVRDSKRFRALLEGVRSSGGLRVPRGPWPTSPLRASPRVAP